MDIKPTTTPVSLPVNDAQRLDSTSKQVDAAERMAFEAQRNPATIADTVNALSVDVGETRISQDPWLEEASASQRLLLTSLSPDSAPGDVGALSLPDAVRTAVDFIFTEPQ